MSNITDPLQIPNAIAKHFSFHGARASETRKYRGYTVYLAEGGPHYDAKKMPSLPEDMKWMLSGYYLSVWALLNGLAVMGRPAYFAMAHNLELPAKTRVYARLNAAMGDAEDHIDQAIYAGWLQNRSLITVPLRPLVRAH